MNPRKQETLIGAEDVVARRMRLEREAREWSPADLARALTNAGCPINQSSIWKIENGKPRRRISLDEAVAISRVFNITMEDLLTPVSAAKYKPPSIQERILQIQDLLAKDVGELDATTRANLLRMQSELADRLEEEGEHVYRLQSDAQRAGGVAGARQQGVQRRDGVGTWRALNDVLTDVGGRDTVTAPETASSRATSRPAERRRCGSTRRRPSSSRVRPSRPVAAR